MGRISSHKELKYAHFDELRLHSFHLRCFTTELRLYRQNSLPFDSNLLSEWDYLHQEWQRLKEQYYFLISTPLPDRRLYSDSTRPFNRVIKTTLVNYQPSYPSIYLTFNVMPN